jgi:peptide deformylase
MALRKIRIWPDPELKQVARRVAEVDGTIKSLVDDMFETMYKANGIGFAATQIGVSQRVVVIDLDPKGHSKDDEEVRREIESFGFKGPTAFINPEIVAAEGEIVWEEGCLSVPGVNEPVKRKEMVTVKAVGIDGNEFTVDATGLFAVCLQHETDHLNGKVFVEYLSKLKRDVIRRKMERLVAEEEAEGAERSAGSKSAVL